jgi:hypothetical protein
VTRSNVGLFGNSQIHDLHQPNSRRFLHAFRFGQHFPPTAPGAAFRACVKNSVRAIFKSICNSLQKFINDLRKLVLFFTQALHAASPSFRQAGETGLAAL